MDLEKMRTVMKQKKITQKDLSKLSNVPIQTIKYILTGRTPNPRTDTAEAIEKALELDNDGITVVQYAGLTETEKRLLTAFNSLIPPMQDYIIKMVEELTETKIDLKK